MGTKNNPGAFDCYANAEPDEPIFILRGCDAMAPMLVAIWASMREAQCENPQKVEEAYDCAEAMRAWAEAKGKLLPGFNVLLSAVGRLVDSSARGGPAALIVGPQVRA
jgi:hypothetical protein